MRIATTTGSSGKTVSSINSTKTAGKSNEELQFFSQDIITLQQKIAEISGDPSTIPTASVSTPGSPFVSGLRALADVGRDETEEKLRSYEKLLAKIGELDRLVLKKTTPPENVDQPRPRRLSKNNDLHYLPTHLHVIDRMMDLFNQAKRVTVIRTGSGSKLDIGDGTPPPVGGEDKTIRQPTPPPLPARNNNPRPTIEKTTETDRSEIIALEKESNGLKTENTELKNKLRELESAKAALEKKINENVNTIETLQKSSNSFDTQIAKEKEKKDIEIKELASKLEQSALRVQESDERCKILEASLHAKMSEKPIVINNTNNAALSKLIRMKTNSLSALNLNVFDDSGPNGSITLSNGSAFSTLMKGHRVSVNEEIDLEIKQSISEFDDQLESNISRLCDTIMLLNSVKESLETEISTYQLERSLLNKDLSSLQSQHDALKAAYHALEGENVSNTRRLLQQNNSTTSGNGNTVETLQKRVEDLQETLLQVQTDSQKNARKLMAYEKLPERIAELELKIHDYENKNQRLETDANQYKADLEHYKHLSNTLKEKLRSLSVKNNGDNKEFLDSFEEVMREEMMTMKMAFETKLKIAKEEADSVSRRHLQEIQRMQSSGSLPSYKHAR